MLSRPRHQFVLGSAEAVADIGVVAGVGRWIFGAASRVAALAVHLLKVLSAGRRAVCGAGVDVMACRLGVADGVLDLRRGGRAEEEEGGDCCEREQRPLGRAGREEHWQMGALVSLYGSRTN